MTKQGSQPNRKTKLVLNTVMGIVTQVITVVCGFVLPRFMLLYFGSAVNGLVTSISGFLGVIAFLDMGVGAVVQSNLYKPLADKDRTQLSLILKSCERFFRRLGFIFIAYIIVLFFAYPQIVGDSFSFWFSASLILILSVSTLAQYLFGITYQILLNADQRSYVQLSLQTGIIVANTVFAVILMQMGASIHVVKLMTATLYLLRPLGQMLYVHRHYDIDKNVKLAGEPIKQKWNGFSQHFAAVVLGKIDVWVLTAFSTLENVSVYSVYYTVTYGIEQLLLTVTTGVQSLLGNMIAKREDKLLAETFGLIEWVLHIGVTGVFTVSALTIVPFVCVYTAGVSDANYNVPILGALLVLAYGLLCLRVPYFALVKAAGHYKQTQNGAWISALINIVITVALVFNFGLVGAAIGTVCAMAYHTCYFVWYLRKNILNRSPLVFAGYVGVDILTVLFSYLIAGRWAFVGETYLEWGIFLAKVGAVVILVSLIMTAVFYRKQVVKAYRLIKHRS